MPHAALDFTNGDSYQRFTITDANVTAHSKVIVSVQCLDVLTANDLGWVFIPNIVSVADGSFDVKVQALPVDGTPDPNNDFPNEQVTLIYQIGT